MEINSSSNNVGKIVQPIYSNKVKSNVLPAFRGRAGFEIIQDSFNKSVTLTQETAFFRQISGLNFVKDFVSKNFSDKKVVNILDGACSTGEESWTLAMLFHNSPQKISITGFDLGKKAIERAKSGVYPISKTYDINLSIHDAYKDSYLAFHSVSQLSEQQKEYQKLFNEFFEPLPILNEQNMISDLMRKFISKKAAYSNLETVYYKIKPDKASKCDFREGDIRNLDSVSGDKKADVFLFRNALYHLLTREEVVLDRIVRVRKSDSDIEKELNDFCGSVSGKLSKNGLLVFGNNETFPFYDKGLTYRTLEEKGFIPLLIENGKFPVVWKKLNE